MNRKELHDFIEEKQPNICQISCYKDGKEVYSDEWNNYKKIDTCHVMSATKSIVALLVGIALDKGFIKSTDQPVLDFFPEYKIKRGEKTIQKVTIKLDIENPIIRINTAFKGCSSLEKISVLPRIYHN